MREGGHLNDEARLLVARFLQRCLAYAEASIERKTARGEDAASWAAYLEHTTFALSEVEQGRLDAWLDAPDVDAEPHRTGLRLGPSPVRTNVDALDHPERAALLSALISPRPLALVATEDKQGRPNIAPMTSVAVVSNTPPLLTMSLSADREGRVRDTLLNLRSTGRATMYLLLPGPDDAALVQATAASLPHGRSEWDTIPHADDEEGKPVLDQAAASLEVELVDEHTLPDAVATLVVLKVVDACLPPGHAEGGVLDLLCQHGQDRLMASPTGWTHAVDHGAP